jgi:hypothetical protein
VAITPVQETCAAHVRRPDTAWAASAQPAPTKPAPLRDLVSGELPDYQLSRRSMRLTCQRRRVIRESFGRISIIGSGI